MHGQDRRSSFTVTHATASVLQSGQSSASATTAENVKGQPIAYQDLTQRLRYALQQHDNVHLRHLNCHSGVDGKEMADHLAVQGPGRPQTRAHRYNTY